MLSEVDLIRAESMIELYHARWSEEPLRTLAVEVEYRAPLVNPATGASSRTFQRAGKIDAIAEDAEGRVWLVEHKCLAPDARIFDHVTGTYETAEALFASGRAPLVTAMDDAGRIVTAQAEPLRRASVRRIFRIQTKAGRTLRVSGNHPIWTSGGWVAASMLEPGAWVGTPRHAPSACAGTSLSNEAIRMIGYMIGDGCMSNMMFCKADENVMADVVACSRLLGEVAEVKPGGGNRPHYVKFSNARAGRYDRPAPVLELMRQAKLEDSASADKRLPLHLGLSDVQLGQLIGALWSTDGCIDNQHALRIVYTSRSRGLCEDIQWALQRLGVVSFVRTTSVSYKGERRPVSTCQVVSRAGRARFVSLWAEGIIPIVRARVTVEQARNAISDAKQGGDARMQPHLDANVWWDRVVSITSEADEQTYDLTVPGPHTFVCEGIITHNTSAEDISPGSDYFDRLSIDGQISHYVAGARALGFEPAGCIYDVLGKPRHQPLQATPLEARKYVAKTGALYANQRAEDEPLEAFRERLRAALVAAPDDFARRAHVVRLEADMDDAAFDDWQTARAIREAELAGRWPRSPEACTRFGSRCFAWSVCTRTGTLDDLPQRTPHEELSTANRSLPLLTPSSAKTFRACARQYRHRYIDGRGGRGAPAAAFGTLVHAGLAAWWSEVGEARLPAAIETMRRHLTLSQQEAA